MTEDKLSARVLREVAQTIGSMKAYPGVTEALDKLCELLAARAAALDAGEREKHEWTKGELAGKDIEYCRHCLAARCGWNDNDPCQRARNGTRTVTLTREEISGLFGDIDRAHASSRVALEWLRARLGAGE